MSDSPWGNNQIQVDPRSVRRAVRLGIVLFTVLVVGSFLMSSLVPYTEYLWFTHDVRHPQVFLKSYSTKGMLLIACWLFSWAFLYWNLKQALSLTLIYLRAPDTAAQAIVSHTMKWVQDRGLALLRIASPIAAFVLALGFSNEWQTFLLATNSQQFGMKDPMFQLDVGFFVFTLPWLRAIANLVLILFLLTTGLSLALYVGLQSLAMLAHIELNRPRFRTHVSLLIGASLLAVAAQMWLRSYEYALADSAQFTGAGYVESRQMLVQRALAMLVAATGVLTMALPRRGKPYSIPMAGGLAIAVAWVLGMLIYPAAIKRIVVDPDRLEKEGPYAKRAIQMTRFAYGLDKIEVRDFDVAERPTPQEVAASEATLDNMRLWDPEVLRSALESLQGFRPYYRFEDVDIDRYTIDGRKTMVMLSPRDIELDGLEPSARNWTNLRLRYTHGYGIAMARVDRVTEEGRPVYLARDIPLKTNATLPISQPRIYFSDWRDAMGRPKSEYALVNTGELELDYETTSGAETHQWTGDRGIPVSGFLSRLAFSAVLRDGNLLVSPNVRPGAKLLMRRNVLERVQHVYPFLKFDTDPYLVVLDGRLLWVLDGYSVTRMVPYSERLFGINYIRNSVKATVDAYTGEVNAYAVLPDEPILRAFQKVYPGLIKRLDQAPNGLREHFRYPEDLLLTQSVQLQTYHVTDPTTFLSNSDAWNIAAEADLHKQRAPIRPYYVLMKLPDEPHAGFLQILPFTPNRKPNMSGWLAAHGDPQHYGRLTLYRFVGSSLVKGPEQMESDFNSTPEISEINRQFNNDQSVVIPGNLLVVPIGSSVIYVEPLFLQNRTSGIQAVPRLAWVVLALNDRVVVGKTYQEALARLLGTQAPPAQRGEQATPSPQPSQPAPQDPQGVREALRLLNEAEAAQRQGDWARYGELQRRLRAKLQELAGG